MCPNTHKSEQNTHTHTHTHTQNNKKIKKKTNGKRELRKQQKMEEAKEKEMEIEEEIERQQTNHSKLYDPTQYTQLTPVISKVIEAFLSLRKRSVIGHGFTKGVTSLISWIFEETIGNFFHSQVIFVFFVIFCDILIPQL